MPEGSYDISKLLGAGLPVYSIQNTVYSVRILMPYGSCDESESSCVILLVYCIQNTVYNMRI